jgi:antitoxin (DNA-binding transcriptional repressor) of toxin-antitoxin stability system
VVKLNIHDAKTHLSAYLEQLEKGDEDVVVICRRNEPIAELRAIRRSRSKRNLFRPDPRLKIAKSFFEPLPDDLLDAFEGKR